jgi:hypothetical protein
MAITYTSRGRIIKVDYSENVDVLAQIAAAFDRIDSRLGAVSCTSTTRPSGTDLYTGLPIYETDTGRFAVWNGSAWKGHAGGTYAGTTNAFGDLNIPSTGFASWDWFVVASGDMVRNNMVVAPYNPFPSNPTPSIKCWTGNTGGGILNTVVRVNWHGYGSFS